MNEAFRAYAFGRAFRIDLSENHVQTLDALCRGDAIATLGLGNSMSGLLRRGFVERQYDPSTNSWRFKPTRAGMLVHDLLTEAGETAAMDAKRRETLDLEAELQRREWDERFGKVKIALKDRFRITTTVPEA